MLPFKLVYHSDYDFGLGQHVFPAHKYRLIREQLLEQSFASEDDFLEPEAASDEDLRLAHDADWIRRLRSGLLTFEEIMRMEIPWNERVLRGFWRHTGGTILTSRLALRDRIAFNVGGGFHHAFPNHGEGFVRSTMSRWRFEGSSMMARSQQPWSSIAMFITGT